MWIFKRLWDGMTSKEENDKFEKMIRVHENSMFENSDGYVPPEDTPTPEKKQG